jgi:hypothetical protein
MRRAHKQNNHRQRVVHVSGRCHADMHTCHVDMSCTRETHTHMRCTPKGSSSRMHTDIHTRHAQLFAGGWLIFFMAHIRMDSWRSSSSSKSGRTRPSYDDHNWLREIVALSVLCFVVAAAAVFRFFKAPTLPLARWTRQAARSTVSAP